MPSLSLPKYQLTVKHTDTLQIYYEEAMCHELKYLKPTIYLFIKVTLVNDKFFIVPLLGVKIVPFLLEVLWVELFKIELYCCTS
jgi:hypothetical protein